MLRACVPRHAAPAPSPESRVRRRASLTYYANLRGRFRASREGLGPAGEPALRAATRLRGTNYERHQRHDAPRADHRGRSRRGAPAPSARRCIDGGRDPYGHAFAVLAPPGRRWPTSTRASRTAHRHRRRGRQVAGRIMAKRDQGKVAFLELQRLHGRPSSSSAASTRSGEDAFAELKDLDVGDWIGVHGHHDAHEARAAFRGRPSRSSCCPRACARCPRSSTAWPTRRRATASAMSTSS